MATRGPATMKTREWLFHCEDLALAGLPAGFPRLERRVMWTILQFSDGEPEIHFEVQPRMGRRQVEVGLHFESDAERNAGCGAVVAQYADEIRAELGWEWELEEWTASWWRVHRVFRFERLTAEFAREVAGEFSKAMVALLPVMQEAMGKAPRAAAVARKPAPSRGRRSRGSRARV